MMAFDGVRNSWLIAAKNCDLAVLAHSAAWWAASAAERPASGGAEALMHRAGDHPRRQQRQKKAETAQEHPQAVVKQGRFGLAIAPRDKADRLFAGLAERQGCASRAVVERNGEGDLPKAWARSQAGECGGLEANADPQEIRPVTEVKWSLDRWR
jgi:hypothetical protein